MTRWPPATLALAAHEITHLTHHGRGYRAHSAQWFEQVQRLLDTAALTTTSRPAAGPPSKSPAIAKETSRCLSSR